MCPMGTEFRRQMNALSENSRLSNAQFAFVFLTPQALLRHNTFNPSGTRNKIGMEGCESGVTSNGSHAAFMQKCTENRTMPTRSGGSGICCWSTPAAIPRRR